MPIDIDKLIPPGEQLAIARDVLRSRASDYLRLSLQPASTTPERLEQLENEIYEVQARVTEMEKAASAASAADKKRK